ncbi:MULTISPECIES: hypothetical protein [Shewanella]|jgi:hypothetical protein|uniref:hypothetical protein n=1 Tax=Shewanella TaxID=22 RepID=UPI00200D026F|nr:MULTISPECIES: hypothetical protein [Shewanella]MCL1088022.1 hypothetical protein [Shewanella profunda]MCS6114506.1 hypothetical protein [Shewanella baltica]MCS6241532.1 hypothetical protein [Shewanella baltica]UVW65411.1 hypothetical protein HHE93_18300 [Shewanella baltica]
MNSISELYLSGMSIEEVSAETGISMWIVRSTLRKQGISRPRKLAISMSKRKETRNDGYLDKLEKKESALYIKANQLFKPLSRSH